MAAFHGSDLEKIEQIYGIKKEEITGFGANVNPLGLSPFMKDYLAAHLDVLCAYPDRNYTALRRAIADYTGADVENIMVGKRLHRAYLCRNTGQHILMPQSYLGLLIQSMSVS